MYGFYKRQQLLEKIHQSGLIDYLNNTLLPSAIFLFGSCAKGEYNVKNDIDLFIVCKETTISLIRYEKRLKHKINIIFEQNIGNLSKELLNNIINGIRLSGFLKIN